MSNRYQKIVDKAKESPWYDEKARHAKEEAELMIENARLRQRIAELERERDEAWMVIEGNNRMVDNLNSQLAAAQATIQQMRDDFLTLARMAEDLKRDCGMDPESPQAIRNAQYMNLSYLARRNLALPNDRTALDAMLADARKEAVPSFDALCAALIGSRVVEQEAIEDAEDYDDCQMLERVRACHRRLHQAAERSE